MPVLLWDILGSSNYFAVRTMLSTMWLCQIQYVKSSMTLIKGSRSNVWYVSKGIDKCYKYAHLFDSRIQPKCFLHWNTYKKWTLAHKIQKKGHSDLITGASIKGHLRSLDTKIQSRRSFRDETWPANGQTQTQTDRQTDRRTPDGAWWHDLSWAEL